MAANDTLTTRLDQLIDLFNRRSLDLPDGILTRHTQFVLNGVAFEEMLGRSPTDPLVRMLTRGPAGYRFTAKAVQHAIPDARLQRGELDETADGDVLRVSGQCWLSGHYRGTADAAELLINLNLTVRNQGIEQATAALDPQQLARVREARLLP
jgi:hypothetical protein